MCPCLPNLTAFAPLWWEDLEEKSPAEGWKKPASDFNPSSRLEEPPRGKLHGMKSPRKTGFASLLAQFEELHVFKLLFFFFLLHKQNSCFFQPTLMNTRRQAEKRSDVKIRLFVKWTSTLLLTPAQPLVVLCAHLFFPLEKGSIFWGKKKKREKKINKSHLPSPQSLQ